jgi:hypothetical protein
MHHEIKIMQETEILIARLEELAKINPELLSGKGGAK